jgi:hypothetical protein
MRAMRWEGKQERGGRSAYCVERVAGCQTHPGCIHQSANQAHRLLGNDQGCCAFYVFAFSASPREIRLASSYECTLPPGAFTVWGNAPFLFPRTQGKGFQIERRASRLPLLVNAPRTLGLRLVYV